MAFKNKQGLYVCQFCGYTNHSPMLVEAHIDNDHDVVYIPVDKGELWRLMQLVYKYAGNEPELVPEAMIRRLAKYLRHQKVIKKQENLDLSDI